MKKKSAYIDQNCSDRNYGNSRVNHADFQVKRDIYRATHKQKKNWNKNKMQEAKRWSENYVWKQARIWPLFAHDWITKAIERREKETQSKYAHT